MRLGGAGLIAAVLALAGCKHSGDSRAKDREPTGLSAARKKGKDTKETKDPKAPAWLDSVATGPAAGTSIPKGNWNQDPNNPNFDAKTAAQDAIGGKVVDSFGRPAKGVFIRVEGVKEAPGTAALGIVTNENGYFFSTGLQPGQTYNLRAEATEGGKQLSGSVQTRVPNPILLITLREDTSGLPPKNGSPPASGDNGGFPPPPTPVNGDHIPPMGLGGANSTAPRPSRDDDAFSPETGSTRSLPPSIGMPSKPTTRPTPPGSSSDLPEPEDLSLPPGKPSRPENVANGPENKFAPPPASIPGPNVPTYPLPPASPPGGAKEKESRANPRTNFRLVDSLERYWDYSTDRAGSVVLLEFVTTACPYCKPAVPILRDAQSRYGASGFQIVAVLCDEAPQKERAAAAAKYARDNNTNYAVFIEPGAKPGDVREQFGVQSYPTAVLLAANGTVLWKGHPLRDRQQLETAIRKALGK